MQYDGEKIQRIAKEAGLTLWDLARASGLPYQTLRYRLKSNIKLEPINAALKTLIQNKEESLTRLSQQL